MRSALECIRQWNAAVAANDVEAVNDLLHPDYRVYEPTGLPYVGVYKGSEGWWALWDQIGAAWTDLRISETKIFQEVDGGDCAIMMRLQGRSSRTGRTFDTTLIEHWTFADGKILAMRPHYYDTAYLSQVHGAEMQSAE